jgi:dephospho-CoA kinase
MDVNMTSKLPLLVGITGGIGSGKSMVCRVFKCLGIPVYDADYRAKFLVENHPGLKLDIVSLLGSDSFTESGTYNRSFVSSKVFGNPVLLAKLNALIHPVVFSDTDKWVQSQGDVPYVLKEAALMNRAGDRNNLNLVIAVQAPLELRVSRIKKRDQRSLEEIESIIARQISDAERVELANYIILNDDKQAIIPQVVQLHTQLLALANSHR